VLRSMVCLLAVSVLGCGGGQEKGPDSPKKADAQERILTVGAAWQEATQTEGYPNQPEIAYLRATDRMTMRFRQGSREALVELEGDELIRTPQGREYHCKVDGAVRGTAKFAWRLEEATVAVHVPAAMLRRACREPGYPTAAKRFAALDATYVLRGDRLVAIDPPTFRSALLPSD